MPATVIVNGMTVVHKSSGGVAVAFPDTCKTPTPGGPVPIPYPNVAQSSDTDKGTKKVKCDGNPVMHEGSNFKMSAGDEAGSAQGVVSNKIKGKAYPKMYSFDVKFEGKCVMRMTDIMLHNGSSPTNTPPTPEVQAPGVALPGDLKPPKVVSVKWSEAEKKCGDEVKIDVKTKNYTDGDLVGVGALVAPDNYVFVANFLETISGDAASIDWITRTNANPRRDQELSLIAFGAGDPAKSSSNLKIKVPEEKKKPGSKLYRTVPKVQQVPAPGGGKTWAAAGGKWGWNYGFELEIKEGVFLVTCKLKLVPQAGLKLKDKHKKRWKKSIEGIWSRRWRVHREKCKRGAACNCWGGCCVFPIVFVCEFVGGGEYAEVNVWPGTPCDYKDAAGKPHQRWWNSANWFMGLCGHEGNKVGVWAHEFGHTIGQYDEYKKGAVFVPTDAAGNVTGQPPFPDVPGSLMGPNGTTINENHLDEYHAWFEKEAGETYKRERL